MIYLDNAATAKPRPEAAAKAAQIISEIWGNPSSLHALGLQSKTEIERARERVANALGAAAQEIVFTSGGTESDNLGIFGACLSRPDIGKHIVTTAVEHSAVSKTVRNLRREHGYTVDYAPMRDNRLDMDAFSRSLTEKTALVSVMLVQNEVGTILPLAELSRLVREKAPNALLHCDAVQGFGKIPFTVDALGVDLLSVSAHKIGGLQGCGALYVKSGVRLFARQFGGGQEAGLRSGTENTPAIAAFGEAVRVTFERFDDENARLRALFDYTLAQLAKRLSDAVVITDGGCAPHIVSFTMPGIDAAKTVARLSGRGIYIGQGAACKSNSPGDEKRGQALTAYGLSDAQIRQTLRVSFCADNTVREIDALINSLLESS